MNSQKHTPIEKTGLIIGDLIAQRDILFNALNDMAGYYRLGLVASAMSKAGEQSAYHRTLNQANAALRTIKKAKEEV